MEESGRWKIPPELWDKLKPLAREMRTQSTPAEEKLWELLRNRQLLGFKFRRQHSLDRFILDFYCHEAKLAVEVDGPIHQYTREEDAVRQEYLESMGIRIIRCTNDEVLNTPDDVLQRISRALTTSNPLSASGEGI